MGDRSATRSSTASSTRCSASDEEAGTSKATSMRSCRCRRRGRRAVDDLVDEAVLAGLFGGEPAVAVRVGLNPLERLPGVEGDALGHHPLEVDDLLGLDRDVGRLALHGPRRLVHQDARVRQGVALARGAGAQQELAHAGGQPDADGRDVGPDVLHGVVDGQAVGDRAARGVDVERDVLVGVLGLEEDQLGADEVGRDLVDRAPDEDDALLEQLLEDPAGGVEVGPGGGDVGGLRMRWPWPRG